MDIQYLLWLQNFRQSLGDGVTYLACLISDVPVEFLALLLCALIYWCLDQETGLYMMTNFSLGRAVNQFLKNTACVFRPWVRDARVLPPERALKSATGYSFPSGHTQRAAALYGGLAWHMRKKSKVVVGICLIVMLAVAFSRNYLGVHTPQDVAVALLESFLVILLTEKIFISVKKARSAADATGDYSVTRVEWLLLAAGIIFSAILVIYILFKPYPSGIVDGELIVDPEKMRLDAFDGAGYMMGLTLGWFMERLLVNTNLTFDGIRKQGQTHKTQPSGESRETGQTHKTQSSGGSREHGQESAELTGSPISLKARILRGLSGAAVLAALQYLCFPFLHDILDIRLYRYLYGFVMYILILFLLPWVFQSVHKAVSR